MLAWHLMQRFIFAQQWVHVTLSLHGWKITSAMSAWHTMQMAQRGSRASVQKWAHEERIAREDSQCTSSLDDFRRLLRRLCHCWRREDAELAAAPIERGLKGQGGESEGKKHNVKVRQTFPPEGPQSRILEQHCNKPLMTGLATARWPLTFSNWEEIKWVVMGRGLSMKWWAFGKAWL